MSEMSAGFRNRHSAKQLWYRTPPPQRCALAGKFKRRNAGLRIDNQSVLSIHLRLHQTAPRARSRANLTGGDMSFARTCLFVAVTLSVLGVNGKPRAQEAPFQFHLMEATIPDVHRAIREGQITCRGLVQAYLNRARAYNGVCNRIVTEEMAPTVLPNFSDYQAAVKSTADRPDGAPGKTPPIEFGRMEPTSSDPTVLQQFGMTVGIPNAGQVRALGMINVRGQRSVTCKGDFDKHPSAGALPAAAPPNCEGIPPPPGPPERPP